MAWETCSKCGVGWDPRLQTGCDRCPKGVTMSFEEKMESGYYKNPLPYGKAPSERLAHRQRGNELHAEWQKDFNAWLVLMGVPEQYAPKLAAFAYDQWHAEGYGQIVSNAIDLVAIFR